jgi:hypothetical protein
MPKADKIGIVALLTLCVIEVIVLLWPRSTGSKTAGDTNLQHTSGSATDSGGAPIAGSTETPGGASRQIVAPTTPEEKPKPSQTLGVTDVVSVMSLSRNNIVPVF